MTAAAWRGGRCRYDERAGDVGRACGRGAGWAWTERGGSEGAGDCLSSVVESSPAGRPAERASEQAKVKVLDFLSILQTGLAATATAATAAPLPLPPLPSLPERRHLWPDSCAVPPFARSPSFPPSLCTTPMAFGKSGALTAMAKAAAIPELNFDGWTDGLKNTFWRQLCEVRFATQEKKGRRMEGGKGGGGE